MYTNARLGSMGLMGGMAPRRIATAPLHNRHNTNSGAYCIHTPVWDNNIEMVRIRFQISERERERREEEEEKNKLSSSSNEVSKHAKCCAICGQALLRYGLCAFIHKLGNRRQKKKKKKSIDKRNQHKCNAPPTENSNQYGFPWQLSAVLILVVPEIMNW